MFLSTLVRHLSLGEHFFAIAEADEVAMHRAIKTKESFILAVGTRDD
jgi:hypothetical protein